MTYYIKVNNYKDALKAYNRLCKVTQQQDKGTSKAFKRYTQYKYKDEPAIIITELYQSSKVLCYYDEYYGDAPINIRFENKELRLNNIIKY